MGYAEKHTSLIRITAPRASNGDSPETFHAIEPVELADFKAHARIDHTLEDTYLETLLSAARERVEEIECWIQMLTATFELRLDAFPCGDEPIVIPRPPLQEVLSIKYVDPAGDLQTLADSTVSPAITSSVYAVDTKSSHAPEPAEIYLAYGQTWPSTRCERNAVRVRFVCGFGDEPADVPAALRQWMMIAASTMYEHREKEITVTIISKFEFVNGLLDPFRCKEFVG